MKITTALSISACCVPFAIGAKAVRGQKPVVKDLESKLHRRLSGHNGGGGGTCPHADSQYNANITTNLDLSAFSQSNNYGALGDCYYNCTNESGEDREPTASDPSEYDGFLTLPMFNGGKNDQSQCSPNETSPSGNNCKIAETKIAYDCDEKIFCAAAYLTYDHVLGDDNFPYSGSFLQTPPGGIAEDGNVFVEFGSGGGAAKLNVNGGTGGLADAEVVNVKYITDPDITTDGNPLAAGGSNAAYLGWEGCWSNVDFTYTNNQGEEIDLLKQELRVHFNMNYGSGNTVATGQGDGTILCGTGDCSGVVDPCSTVSCNDGECCYVDPLTDLASCSSDIEECPELCTAALCASKYNETSVCQEYECLDEVDPVTGNVCRTNNLPSETECGLGTECTKEVCVEGQCVSRNVDGSCSLGQCCSGQCQADCNGCPNGCEWSFSVSSSDSSPPVNEVNDVVDLSSDIDITCKPTGIPADYDYTVTATDCENNAAGAMTPGTDIDTTASSAACASFQRPFTTTGTDCQSNIGMYSLEFIYTDTVPPTLTQPEDEIQECGDTSTVNRIGEPSTDATSDDDCAGSGTITRNDGVVGLDAPCEKQITYTWSQEDDCGNVGTSSPTMVTVLDTLAPVFDAPATQLASCGSVNFTTDGFPDNLVTPTVSDQCGNSPEVEPWGSFVADSTTSVCDLDGQKNTVTWRASDACGNSVHKDQLYYIKDNTAPVFESVPGRFDFRCQDPCVVGGLHPGCTGGLAVASDLCWGPTENVSHEDCEVAGVEGLPGVTITRTFTATDVCGLSSMATQTIAVVDECSGTISNSFSGVNIDVEIGVVNLAAGLMITVTEVDAARDGDLRALFFQLSKPASFAGTDQEFADYVESLTFTTESCSGYKTPCSLGNVICSVDGVDKVANDALMKGGGQNMPVYTCGVEFGSSGKAKDDIQSITFTVNAADGPSPSTDMLYDPLCDPTTNCDPDPYFAVRVTSVTDLTDGERSESSKVYGKISCCRHPISNSCSGGSSCGDGTCDPGEDCPEDCDGDDTCTCPGGQVLDCPPATRRELRLGSSLNFMA